jgi:hypothetical protein
MLLVLVLYVTSTRSLCYQYSFCMLLVLVPYVTSTRTAHNMRLYFKHPLFILLYKVSYKRKLSKRSVLCTCVWQRDVLVSNTAPCISSRISCCMYLGAGTPVYVTVPEVELLKVAFAWRLKGCLQIRMLRYQQHWCWGFVPRGILRLLILDVLEERIAFIF